LLSQSGIILFVRTVLVSVNSVDLQLNFTVH